MNAKNIKTIVIAGGGTAGWMTAAAFAKTFRNKLYKIILIESDAIGTIGVGEATIPNITQYNKVIGIDEFDFLKYCKGTFKYGIEFKHWSTTESCYMHPFGDYGSSIYNLQFYHYWQRLKQEGLAENLSEYSLSIKAAYQNKFSRPVNIPNSPMNKISYAYHFDSGLYAQYLRKFAEQNGIIRIEDKIEKVHINNTSGEIDKLTLEKSGVLEGDFFIDCTGFRSLLLGDALRVPYLDWSNYLPCDRAVTVATEKLTPLPPYTQSLALSAGWKWRIPLQHRTGNGYVFSSHFIDEEKATESLLEHCNTLLPESKPRSIKFTTGRRQTFWKKNCVAIGLSSGFMEPLESTSIYLIQSAIGKLLALFPNASSSQVETNKFNEQICHDFDSIRDFLILHYKATERTDSEFWRYCKNMDIPDSLQEKMDLYKNGSRIYRENGELFGEVSWLAVMDGQGIKAKGYNPMVDSIDISAIAKQVEHFKEVINNSVNVMADHEDFISKYCLSESMN